MREICVAEQLKASQEGVLFTELLQSCLFLKLLFSTARIQYVWHYFGVTCVCNIVSESPALFPMQLLLQQLALLQKLPDYVKSQEDWATFLVFRRKKN
jgi:hypothetical protein